MIVIKVFFKYKNKKHFYFNHLHNVQTILTKKMIFKREPNLWDNMIVQNNIIHNYP